MTDKTYTREEYQDAVRKSQIIALRVAAQVVRNNEDADRLRDMATELETV